MVVLSISAGAVHSLIIRGDGKVLGTGISHRGQLGQRENYPIDWTMVDDSTTYTAISAGSVHSLLLTADGKVIMATSRSRTREEREAAKKENRTNRFLQPIRDLPKVVSFSAGYGFSLFIVDDRKMVWCMGENEYGQLGTGDTEPTQEPVQMGYKDAKQVSAGSSHSLVLDEDGTVYACGRNSNGALGLGKQNADLLELELIKDFGGIQAISAGWNHSLFLSRDGEVFGCGSGLYGELGNKEPITLWKPVKIDGLPKIKAISAGHSHSVFLSEEGEVWECGKSVDKRYLSLTGQFGVRKIEGLPKIKSISAGFNFYSLYLDEEGCAWGRGLNSCCNIGITPRLKRSSIFVPEPEIIGKRVAYTKRNLLLLKKKKRLIPLNKKLLIMLKHNL